MPLIHRQSPLFRVRHHLQSLLLQEFFLVGLRLKRDAVRARMVVFVQIGEGGETIGGDFFGLTAAVHFCVDGQGAATHGDDFALESDNVAGENRELEINAMKDEKNGVLRINILRHSEIGTLQEPLRTTTREKGLVMVEVGEFD